MFVFENFLQIIVSNVCQKDIKVSTYEKLAATFALPFDTNNKGVRVYSYC